LIYYLVELSVLVFDWNLHPNDFLVEGNLKYLDFFESCLLTFSGGVSKVFLPEPPTVDGRPSVDLHKIKDILCLLLNSVARENIFEPKVSQTGLADEVGSS
jgi:hypothetical protein